MRFYPNSNTECLNWVKRPHGDSLGDAAQPPCLLWGGAGVRACEISFSGV